MIFSELSAIEAQTGLTYDSENAILGGTKNGIPLAVFDNNRQHRFDIICGAFVDDSVIKDIERLTESFPKKTVLGIENVKGCVKIYCKGFNLMQENLPLLIAFLEKLTLLAAEKKKAITEFDADSVTALADYAVIVKKKPAADNVIKKVPKGQRPPLNVKDTLKGVLGGIIGLLIGCSIFVVFILLSDLVGWIGGLVMSAAVVSMYTVFSHKLKAPDAIITALMILVGWLFSNGFAYLFRIFLNQQEAGQTVNLFTILGDIGYYASKYYEQTNLLTNNMTVSFVFVVAGAIGSYFFYYKHHANDMY